MEGNIVVEDILASCYAFTDHDLAHTGVMPMRYFPWIAAWVLGENNGSPVFVEIAQQLGSVIMPYGIREWLN